MTYDDFSFAVLVSQYLFRFIYFASSHSGFDEPRGSSTVRKAPGVRDKTTWSVMPWYVPNGVSAVKRSGATFACSSVEPAVSFAYALSNIPSESSQSTVLVRDTTTR